MKRKEQLEQESLEEQVEEMRKSMFKLMEHLLPPKEVRREVIRNIHNIELSFWKILKTVVDYEVSRIEGKMSEAEKKEKVKRIEVE